MNLHQYTVLADRTSIRTNSDLDVDAHNSTWKVAEVNPLNRLDHGITGAITEISEMLSVLKAVRFYGKKFDEVNFKEEIGDFIWFMVHAIYHTKDMYSNSTEKCKTNASKMIEFYNNSCKEFVNESQKVNLLEDIKKFRNPYHAMQSFLITITERLCNTYMFLELQPGFKHYNTESEVLSTQEAFLKIQAQLYSTLVSVVSFFSIYYDVFSDEEASILSKNLAKLELRYKKKQFELEATSNRDLEAERKVLEN